MLGRCSMRPSSFRFDHGDGIISIKAFMQEVVA